MSGAGPGLQCQFSCSLCVTAGVCVRDVTPTTCCFFLPHAGLPFSSAKLGWFQCHCLGLLAHWGRGKLSHWTPKTAVLTQTFLAVVLDLSLWELSLLNHELGSGPSASSQPSCPAKMSWRAWKWEETHRSYSARLCWLLGFGEPDQNAPLPVPDMALSLPKPCLWLM